MKRFAKAFHHPVRCTRWVVALAGLWFSSAAAYAQGCAMCYTSAAAAKAGALQALRTGILILLVPALVMFAGIFVVIYRSRNRFGGSGGWTAAQERELREMLLQMERVESPVPQERIVPSVVRSPLSVASRQATTSDWQRATDH
jgi:hypothetical protein